MSTPADSLRWPGDPDDTMDQCNRRAHALYQADDVLSHERVAYGLAEFLFHRLREQPTTPERDALLSVIGRDCRTATYLSCGQKLIVGAMARLLRLAIPYDGHPDYRQEWTVTP